MRHGLAEVKANRLLGFSETLHSRIVSAPSRDSYGVPMGLRPTKSDEGAAGGWRGIKDLRRVFNRAALKAYEVIHELYLGRVASRDNS